MDTPTTVADVTPAAPPESGSTTIERDELLIDDLLVEEISIDGMCGVY